MKKKEEKEMNEKEIKEKKMNEKEMKEKEILYLIELEKYRNNECHGGC